jgi:hypothetical protein
MRSARVVSSVIRTTFARDKDLGPGPTPFPACAQHDKDTIQGNTLHAEPIKLRAVYIPRGGKALAFFGLTLVSHLTYISRNFGHETGFLNSCPGQVCERGLP